jgi:hypothetical protein
MCQRGVGAPLTAWVNLPLEGFAWVADEPSWYRSSPDLRRGFCPACGGSICTLADGDAYVCVTIPSLDDPEGISPAFHMWTSSQLSWLEVEDKLPRHEAQG